MCMQCVAGAMSAGAGATGARAWLVIRVGQLMTPGRKKGLSAVLIVAGVTGGAMIGPQA
jgi:hypothetical protein